MSLNVRVASPGSTTETLAVSGGRTRSRRTTRGWSTNGLLLSAISLAVGILAWEIAGRTLNLLFLPPASAVFARAFELVFDGTILPVLAGSLQNLFIGYLIAVVAGVLLGVLMARIWWLEKMLDPYVYALLTAPAVVFVPIYFAVFGLSPVAIIALIVQYSMFIIVVNTVAAVKAVDTSLLEMGLVFGADTHWRTVRYIILRASFPMMAAGLRLGLGRAIKGMVNGELLIAVVGLGALSGRYSRAYDAEGIMAVLVIVIIVALILDRAALFVDDRINRWLPDSHR